MDILNKEILITGSEEGWLTVENMNSEQKGVSQKISIKQIRLIQVLKDNTFITYDNEFMKIWDNSNGLVKKISEKKLNDLFHFRITSDDKMINFSNKEIA